MVNLTNPVLERHRLAVRADCHVAEYEGVIRDRFFGLELGKQLSLKTTHPRFVDCTRMMSYQSSNAVSGADSAEKTGTVERVKTRVCHVRPVADVVQPRCGHQSAVSQPERLGDARCLTSDALDMLPSAWQRTSQVLPRQS